MDIHSSGGFSRAPSKIFSLLFAQKEHEEFKLPAVDGRRLV